MLEIAELKQKKLPELQEIAKSLGIKGITGQKKMDLAYSIIDHIASQPEKIEKQEDNKPKETSKKTLAEQVSKEPQNSKPKTEKKNPNQNGKQSKVVEQNKNQHNNRENNHNKDTRNKYRQPDYEFEGIIESEGVLEMMPEGYGFLRSSDYN